MNAAAARQIVHLQHAADGRFFGMRHAAVPARASIAGFLAQGFDVVVDFGGASVTQSFVDELVGRLLLEQGPDVLQRIIFKNCSDDTRAVIRFVTADRADQYRLSERRGSRAVGRGGPPRPSCPPGAMSL
jgi:hypothetical protein